MELGGYPAQDIELDSDLVSVLSVNALLQVETLLDEEMSLGFARFTPALSEAVLVIGTPGIQLAEWRQFRRPRSISTSEQSLVLISEKKWSTICCVKGCRVPGGQVTLP
jgi:hypothetical protein